MSRVQGASSQHRPGAEQQRAGRCDSCRYPAHADRCHCRTASGFRGTWSADLCRAWCDKPASRAQSCLCPSTALACSPRTVLTMGMHCADSPGGIELGPAAGSPILQRSQGISKRPTFTLMASYASKSLPFDAAQIQGSDVLKLISCNSSRPGVELWSIQPLHCDLMHGSVHVLSLSSWVWQAQSKKAECPANWLPR